MKLLSTFCYTQGFDPVKVMNLLQEWGIVADECVTTKDVADADADLAIRFCRLNRDDLRPD